MSANNKSLLQNVYLFKTMTNDQMEKIAAVAHTETLAIGDDVFSQGDKARALYLIKFGSIKICQRTKSGETIEVARLGTGSHFGEMSFMDNEPRSASATTVEKTELIIVPYEKLTTVLKNDTALAVSFYRELAHFLAGRLRLTTTDLSFSREKNLSHF